MMARGKPSTSKVVENSRAFMVMEATSYAGGGFPAFMNMLMEEMTAELVDAGYLAPFQFRYSGGDGITVPVHIHCRLA